MLTAKAEIDLEDFEYDPMDAFSNASQEEIAVFIEPEQVKLDETDLDMMKAKYRTFKKAYSGLNIECVADLMLKILKKKEDGEMTDELYDKALLWLDEKNAATGKAECLNAAVDVEKVRKI